MNKTRFGKKVINQVFTNWDNEEVECVVVESSYVGYYDVHVVHPFYCTDESNTLKLQVPKESVKDDYFTDLKLNCYTIEFIAWHKFSDNDNVVSFSCSYYQD